MMGTNLINKEEIRKAINILKPEGELFEIRVLSGSATYSGYFNDPETAINELSKINLSGANVYFTLNRLKEACISRKQAHRLIKMYGKDPTTGDRDIEDYSFLFVDIDPVRVSGTSSSQAELKESNITAKRIYNFLNEMGFEEPIKALSGNGSHLLYKIDIPNTDENKTIIQDCLRALDYLYSSFVVKVDVSNFNPARICKLYGTRAQKGANTKDRPHRMSEIFQYPQELKPTPLEVLEILAAEYHKHSDSDPVQPSSNYASSNNFDIESWLDKYGIAHKGAVMKGGDIIYALDVCPFNETHKSSSAVIKRHDGRLCFKCQHDSCQDKHWKDVRLKYEPSYNSPTSRTPQRNNEPAKLNTAHEVIKLNNLDEAEEKSVDWLIPEFIPKGSVTLLAGDGGSGKTTAWCAIAAAVSNGEDPEFLRIVRPETDDGFNPFDNLVFFFTAEDDVERVLLKRLKNSGANLEHIKYLSAADDYFPRIKFNSDELKEIIEQHKPTLCIFDPVQSFIPPEMKMGERNAMRQVLTPLMGYGEKYGTSFLLVAHTNKRQNAWGRNRIADSADLWDACRSVIIVGQCPEDITRYFSQEKNNYAPRAQTRIFTINSFTGKAEFHSYSEMYDQDFVRLVEHKKSAPDREEARDFILDYLSDHSDEETTVGSLFESAKGYGISKHTFDRAKQELKNENKIAIRAKGRDGKSKGTDWIVKLL